MIKTKSIFSSWTIWFGLAQLALGIIGWISGLMENTEALTLITTGIRTIGFRFKTKEPII